jgi:hypothetical protein
VAKVMMVCLFVVGLINFVPAVGVLSAERLESAYSIRLVSNDLVILMRHRALLFGLLGGFVWYSLFFPNYQKAAMTMAGVSMIGFALLTVSTGEYNDSLANVLVADLIGILFLSVAFVLKYNRAEKPT